MSGQSAPATPSATAGLPHSAVRPLLHVQDLEVHFPITEGLLLQRTLGTVRAVDGVSFEISRDETLGLVGESGCGKTTTGRAIVRLLRPSKGSVVFDGQELVGLEGESLRALRRRVQMVFQDPYSSLNPVMPVHWLISEPLMIHRVGTRKQRDERVVELLDLVGLSRTAFDRYPHEFSGGQRQRIGIARALALQPELLVADEPVSALDVSVRAQIINLLEEIQAELHLTYLFIAHDLSLVYHISDRIAVMYLGRITETGGTREVYESPLHPYTVALLSAVLAADPGTESRRKRIILRGDVPSPATPPTGCRFHPRCWLRERLGNPDRCESEEPQLVEGASNHAVACHFADEVRGSSEQEQATAFSGPRRAALMQRALRAAAG